MKNSEEEQQINTYKNMRKNDNNRRKEIPDTILSVTSLKKYYNKFLGNVTLYYSIGIKRKLASRN